MTVEKTRDESNQHKDDLSQLETARCCSNHSSYEITYEYISRKWLVCNQCLDLDFFKTSIKEKVRVKI